MSKQTVIEQIDDIINMAKDLAVPGHEKDSWIISLEQLEDWRELLAS